MLFRSTYNSITEKSCLCVGLANPSLMEFGIPVKGQNQGVVVCPGPNMAYFSKEVSLKEMMEHIYGTKNIENHENRPNMFVKELELYVTYLTNQINDSLAITAQQIKKWETFKTNLTNGISYYKALFTDASTFYSFEKISTDMAVYEQRLQQISYEAVAV